MNICMLIGNVIKIQDRPKRPSSAKDNIEEKFVEVHLNADGREFCIATTGIQAELCSKLQPYDRIGVEGVIHTYQIDGLPVIKAARVHVLLPRSEDE